MVSILSLILPVLIPSWRFFKTIEPSPRVQWALVSGLDDALVDWHDFRPPPATVSPGQMVVRLFWNPTRNEDLFVISCAERIQQKPTAHSIDEIRRRIQDDVAQSGIDTMGQLLQFRLLFVHRASEGMVQEVVFLSDACPANTS